MNSRTDGSVEITPAILQEIVPLGVAAQKHELTGGSPLRALHHRTAPYLRVPLTPLVRDTQSYLDQLINRI